MPPSSVHFNGSVNLADAESVMRAISSRIPSGVRRMTDGETGERNYWIHFQVQKFAAMPEFEAHEPVRVYETKDEAPDMPQLRLSPGVSADAVAWPNLGYADAYTESYELFRRLQAEGKISGGVRFQMQYPTPLAGVAGPFPPDQLPALVGSYGAALFDDLDRALATIPHDRCAVQWDVAFEFGLLEGGFGPTLPVDEVAPPLIACIDHVPDDVPVGMHLCYGDYGHEHFVQPESLATQVALVNALTAGARRPLDFVSFTVPQARDDAAYFAPLSELTASPETELYFALVPYHPDDQGPGTTDRQIEHIDAVLARSAGGAREWGVCTECGMGRVAAGDVPRLLDLHREILEGAALGERASR
jgi:methionine synthase II (cobalamin-independent)